MHRVWSLRGRFIGDVSCGSGRGGQNIFWILFPFFTLYHTNSWTHSFYTLPNKHIALLHKCNPMELLEKRTILAIA